VFKRPLRYGIDVSALTLAGQRIPFCERDCERDAHHVQRIERRSTTSRCVVAPRTGCDEPLRECCARATAARKVGKNLEKPLKSSAVLL